MPSRKPDRLQHRLLFHHLPILIICVVSVSVLYFTRPYRDVISRVSFATAYPALFLVAATLALGPCQVLLRQRNPISSDLRRDLGIWAGILSVIHAVVGQCVHLRGRPWLYYVYGNQGHHTFPIRHDLFGVSNYTGAVSALFILALFATSNDYSLSKLGASRWKQLQRWSYVAFVLAAIHTIGYQSTAKHNAVFMIATAVCLTITIALQLAGFTRRRASISIRS